MTQNEREARIQKHIDLLGCSYAEAEQIVLDDEIIDKGGAGNDLLPIDTELLDDDVYHFVFNCHGILLKNAVCLLVSEREWTRIGPSPVVNAPYTCRH